MCTAAVSKKDDSGPIIATWCVIPVLQEIEEHQEILCVHRMPKLRIFVARRGKSVVHYGYWTPRGSQQFPG